MDKISKRDITLKFAGAASLILATVVIILCIITTSDEIQNWYSKYEQILYKIDLAILSVGGESYIVFIIFALYALKCFIPLITIPAICVLTGMVFPTPTALLVNAAGLFFMLTIKYKIGRNYSGGKVLGILEKNDVFKSLMKYADTASPWLLFVFRLIPTFPINTISQIYGYHKFNYKKFMIISMLGFAPKLLSYTFIGVYVFDPLSVSFFIPVIVLLIISGATLLSVNAIINHFEKS